MVQSNGEYSRPSVGASGCSYATLNSYNQNYFGRGTGAPVASQTRSNEIVVVPSYGGPGYTSLMHQKEPSCSGYYNVSSAYPSYPACGQFSQSSRLCG